MFNLFKKKTVNAVVDSVKQVFAEPVDVNETILKIHNDFDSASEKLLGEAKRIIANSNEDVISKGERLNALGFKAAKAVVESREQQRAKRDSEILAETIMYFKQWYPLNKFITNKEVKAICEKYNLVFGEAEYYKGDIPEKNIKEIESFVLRQEDKERKTNVDDYLMRRKIKRDMEFALAMVSSSRTPPTYEPYNPPSYTTERFEQPPFKMVAPESDFDMKHMVKTGHEITYHIPDPIVLQPVKGGYLIVSKWGLEASDELVVNEIEN